VHHASGPRPQTSHRTSSGASSVTDSRRVSR
jgi:hypothetical protein